MNGSDLISGLPGELLVREGLADHAAGRSTIAAYLVDVAAPRLRQAGLMLDPPFTPPAESERQLYALLRRDAGDAYSRYNALLRELVSFESALDHRLRQRRRLGFSSP